MHAMPGRSVAAMLAVATIVAGCSWLPLPKTAQPVVQLVDLGGDAYSLTRRSGVFADRAFTLRIDAEQRAVAVCADRHLATAMLETRADDPDPPAYSYATVTFRCVKP
jgi:hypothetical protein